MENSPEQFLYERREQALDDLRDRVERMPSVGKWARDLIGMLNDSLFMEKANAWSKRDEIGREFFQGYERAINLITACISEEERHGTAKERRTG